MIKEINLTHKFYRRFLNKLVDFPKIIIPSSIRVNIIGNELVLVARLSKHSTFLPDIKYVESTLKRDIPESLSEYLTFSVETEQGRYTKESTYIMVNIKLNCNKQTLENLLTIMEIEDGQENTFDAENL